MSVQQGMLEAALWLRDNTDEDAIIGSFNAGIIAHFSQRKVVNLDGVINNAAYEAISSGRMWGFVREQGVNYIADLESRKNEMFNNFYWGEQKPVTRLVYWRLAPQHSQYTYGPYLAVYRIEYPSTQGQGAGK